MCGIAMFAGQLIDISYPKGKEGKTVFILGKGRGLDGQGMLLPNQVV